MIRIYYLCYYLYQKCYPLTIFWRTFEHLTRHEYEIRKSTSVTDINQINRDFVSRKCKQRDAFYARYGANRNRGLRISDKYERRNILVLSRTNLRNLG